MDYDEDEEIDGGFAAEEITKLSDGVPVELWTANMLDYVYKKKYMLAVTEEIEKNCEESAYMIQSGKARIAQKSIKQAVNYFKGASLLSFLLIGEFEQVDKLMELLPKLEKNYKVIAKIINLVCY